MYRHLKVPKLEVQRLQEAKSLKCSQCNFIAISKPRLVAHETLEHKENKPGKWIVKLDDSIIKEERKAIEEASRLEIVRKSVQ